MLLSRILCCLIILIGSFDSFRGYVFYIANSNLEELSENTQAGTKTGISAKGNSVVEYDIMFDKRFPKIPEVVATLHSGTTNPNYGYLAPIVWDVTTTGFKLRIANAYSETFAPDVTWIAVVK